jgi:hypothetical protein
MAKYQPYSNFTAQSRTVSALMSMYAQLERDSAARIELTPFVVFLAFAIESYLNSIGARQFDIWGELERLPWKTKVVILHKTAKRSVDWGIDPLQFATEVFALRDRLAHGKPERVVGPVFNNQCDANRFVDSQNLQPDWYRKIKREWVMEAKERFRLLMTYLGGLFGLHESDYLLQETGGLLVDEEDA